MTEGKGFTIRPLNYGDVDAINEIDRILTMDARPRTGTDLWSHVGETTTSFGAEANGRLVAFVLADVRPYEFGEKTAVGWILALGVHPDWQDKGIGRALGDRVLSEFRRQGVRSASTLVDASGADLRKYFEAIGFKPSDQVVLRARL